MKVQMEVPVTVVKAEKGKVTLLVGSTQKVLFQGDVLTLEFEGKVE